MKKNTMNFSGLRIEIWKDFPNTEQTFSVKPSEPTTKADVFNDASHDLIMTATVIEFLSGYDIPAPL